MFRQFEKKDGKTDNSFYVARKKAAMTLKEASIKSGVNESTIQGWETRRSPTRIKQARALAKAYGCTLGELIGMEVLEGKEHE